MVAISATSFDALPQLFAVRRRAEQGTRLMGMTIHTRLQRSHNAVVHWPAEDCSGKLPRFGFLIWWLRRAGRNAFDRVGA